MKTPLTICAVLLFALVTNSVQADTWAIIDTLQGQVISNKDSLVTKGISSDHILATFTGSSGVSNTFVYTGPKKSGNVVGIIGIRQMVPLGISGDNIVGLCDRRHGFICNWKTCAKKDSIILDAPGARVTVAQGISGDNVVGYYNADSIYTYSFIYNLTTKAWTTLQMPGVTDTAAYGIDGSNIVGTYKLGSITHGFLYNLTTKTWVTIDMPGAGKTIPHGISGNNIVGEYNDKKMHTRGFFYDGKNWMTMDVPDSSYTRLTGIFENKIVGYYGVANTNVARGFLYTISEKTEKVAQSVQPAQQTTKQISELFK